MPKTQKFPKSIFVVSTYTLTLSNVAEDRNSLCVKYAGAFYTLFLKAGSSLAGAAGQETAVTAFTASACSQGHEQATKTLTGPASAVFPKAVSITEGTKTQKGHKAASFNSILIPKFP